MGAGIQRWWRDRKAELAAAREKWDAEQLRILDAYRVTVLNDFTHAIHDTVHVANVIRQVMRELDIQPRPYSDWSDEQKIRMDRLVYGTGVGRLRSDGSLEHVPFNELVFEFNR
jgi:hypothetical protein